MCGSGTGSGGSGGGNSIPGYDKYNPGTAGSNSDKADGLKNNVQSQRNNVIGKEINGKNNSGLPIYLRITGIGDKAVKTTDAYGNDRYSRYIDIIRPDPEFGRSSTENILYKHLVK